MLKLVILLLFFVFHALASARENVPQEPQEKDSVNTDRLISRQLDEIIITATPFTRQLGTVTGTVSHIPKSVITNSQQITIQPVLEQVPGIQMQAGALNTARLTIRGIGSRTPYASNRIKAFFDDIPLTSGDGATIVEDLEMSQIGQIEIIKGPSSALYGPGLGGVIAIKSLQPQNGWHASALAEAGSFDLRKAGGSLSFRQSDNYLKAALTNTRTDGHRENNQYQRTNLLLQGGISHKKHQLSVLANYIDLKAHIPSSINYETYTNAPHKAAANWLAIKGYQEYQKWQTGLTIKSQISAHVDHKIIVYGLLNKAYEPRPFNILDEGTQTIGLKENLTYKKNNLALSLGYELFSENYQWKIFEIEEGRQGPLLSDNKENRFFYNLQAHAEAELGASTVVSAGINLHQLQYRSHDLETDRDQEKHNYRVVLSPRIGINQRVGAHMYLYASAGHGFSAPSPEEALLPDGSINRDLKPEEGINLEVGVRSAWWRDRLLADLTGYHIKVKNLLMTRRDAEDVFYGENAGETRHVGLESQLKFFILPQKSDRELSISASHTWMNNRFVHFIQNEVDYASKQLPGQPASMLNLSLLAQNATGVFLQFQFRHESSQYLNDANTKSYPGHQLYHLTGGYHPPSGTLKRFRFNAGIRNLLNTRYASMLLVNAPSFGGAQPRYYYPGMPRNYYIAIHYSL
jgi:iron complex outermembrane recepter protein